MTADALPPDAGIGRVALRVGDLEGTAEFYESVVGLERLEPDDVPTGPDAGAPLDHDAADVAVLGAAGDALLVLLGDPDAPPRDRSQAGLYHVAIRVPDRTALGAAVERIRSRHRLDGASDHLVSEALYLRDPEGNGLEVYCDRPRSEWTIEGDRVEIDTLPLDLGAVLAESDGADRVPPATDVGHVHLEVTDLDAARECYVDALGMHVRFALDTALFVAAGEYHHHVGLNTWHGRSAPVGEGRGLAWFEVVVPDREALEAATDRLDEAGYEPERGEAGGDVAPVSARDPDGIAFRLRVER